MVISLYEILIIRLHKRGWRFSNVLRAEPTQQHDSLPNRMAVLFSRLLHEYGGIDSHSDKLTFLGLGRRTSL